MSLHAAVHAVIDAANARDFVALGRLMHPGLEFHSVIARSEGSFYRGVDGLREWAATVDEIWDGFHIEVLDVAAGSTDRALVHLRLSGTARASGVPLDVQVAQVWEWRDGLVLRNVVYDDHDEAARAAGLR